jgi:hypothetical protein
MFKFSPWKRYLGITVLSIEYEARWVSELVWKFWRELSCLYPESSIS